MFETLLSLNHNDDDQQSIQEDFLWNLCCCFACASPAVQFFKLLYRYYLVIFPNSDLSLCYVSFVNYSVVTFKDVMTPK